MDAIESEVTTEQSLGDAPNPPNDYVQKIIRVTTRQKQKIKVKNFANLLQLCDPIRSRFLQQRCLNCNHTCTSGFQDTNLPLPNCHLCRPCCLTHKDLEGPQGESGSAEPCQTLKYIGPDTNFPICAGHVSSSNFKPYTSEVGEQGPPYDTREWGEQSGRDTQETGEQGTGIPRSDKGLGEGNVNKSGSMLELINDFFVGARRRCCWYWLLLPLALLFLLLLYPRTRDAILVTNITNQTSWTGGSDTAYGTGDPKFVMDNAEDPNSWKSKQDKATQTDGDIAGVGGPGVSPGSPGVGDGKGQPGYGGRGDGKQDLDENNNLKQPDLTKADASGNDIRSDVGPDGTGGQSDSGRRGSKTGQSGPDGDDTGAPGKNGNNNAGPGSPGYDSQESGNAGDPGQGGGRAGGPGYVQGDGDPGPSGYGPGGDPGASGYGQGDPNGPGYNEGRDGPEALGSQPGKPGSPGYDSGQPGSSRYGEPGIASDQSVGSGRPIYGQEQGSPGSAGYSQVPPGGSGNTASGSAGPGQGRPGGFGLVGISPGNQGSGGQGPLGNGIPGQTDSAQEPYTAVKCPTGTNCGRTFGADVSGGGLGRGPGSDPGGSYPNGGAPGMSGLPPGPDYAASEEDCGCPGGQNRCGTRYY